MTGLDEIETPALLLDAARLKRTLGILSDSGAPLRLNDWT